MKKIFLAVLLTGLFVFTLTGCKKYNESNLKNDLNNDLKSIKSYHIKGDLEIYNGDNVYKYKVETSKNKDKYRVSLINKSNNHEQIILKNDDGVYVLTPALNKSLKFQSSRSENSAQIYLIDFIININNKDEKMKIITNSDGYVVETKLAYSNNKNLVKEKIYFDKNLNIKRVEIYDDDNKLQMKMRFNEVDKRASFTNKYFDVKENIKVNENETETTMSQIDDTIYPMYLPSGTYLASEESVSKEDGKRVILTFQGESPFILVQETISIKDELENVPVSGEPEFVTDTIGAVSGSSISFISNGVEYYLSSDNLTEQEMLQVAESISPITVMK